MTTDPKKNINQNVDKTKKQTLQNKEKNDIDNQSQGNQSMHSTTRKISSKDQELRSTTKNQTHHNQPIKRSKLNKPTELQSSNSLSSRKSKSADSLNQRMDKNQDNSVSNNSDDAYNDAFMKNVESIVAAKKKAQEENKQNNNGNADDTSDNSQQSDKVKSGSPTKSKGAAGATKIVAQLKKGLKNKVKAQLTQQSKPGTKQQGRDTAGQNKVKQALGKGLESKMKEAKAKKDKTKKDKEDDREVDEDNLFTDNDQDPTEDVPSERDPDADPLEGVCLVQKELKKMVEKKYKKALQNAQKVYDQPKIKARFKLTARQVTELSDLAQATMQMKLTFDESQALFKSDVGEFFSALNQNIEKYFGFENINIWVEAEGQAYIIQDEEAMKQKEKEAIKRVQYGDLIKPIFSQKGDLMGFQLRPELTPMLYANNDFDFIQLKRIIRTVMYLNRILQNGQEDDFRMTQFRNGEVIEEEGRKVKDTAIQVNEKEVRDNGFEQSKETQIFEELREHLIKIQSRMNGETSYYDLVYEELNLDQLMKVNLNDVYFDDDAQESQIQITLWDYFQHVFKTIEQKIDGIKDQTDKKFLKMNMIFSGDDEEGGGAGVFRRKKQGDVMMRDRGMQTLQGAKQYGIDRQVQTGKELIKGYKANEPDRRPLGEGLLDQVAREEYFKTLELFDSFTLILAQIDNDLLLNKLNHQLQQENRLLPQNSRINIGEMSGVSHGHSPRKEVNFQSESSSRTPMPQNQAVQGIKIRVNDNEQDPVRNSQPEIEGWDLSPQKVNRAVEHMFEIESPLMNGLKVDDLEALRDKLKQTIDYMRQDFTVTYEKKMQHQQKVKKKKQSPAQRAGTAAYKNFKQGKKYKVPPLNIPDPNKTKENVQISHRDNETYREYFSVNRHNHTAQEIHRQQMRDKIADQFKENSEDEMDFGFMPISQISSTHNDAVSQVIKDQKSVGIASNFSKKNSEASKVSKVKALTYAEQKRLEKLYKVMNKADFSKLTPDQQIAAGFSSHFGNLPDMHSTDLESSMVSGSNKNKLELFGGLLPKTITNKEVTSTSNRANLLSGDSGEAMGQNTGENTERVINLQGKKVKISANPMTFAKSLDSSQASQSPRCLLTQGTDKTLLNDDLTVPNLPELGLRNSKTIDIDSRQQQRAQNHTTNNSPRKDYSFQGKISPRPEQESKFKDYVKSLDVPSVDFSVDELNVPITQSELKNYDQKQDSGYYSKEIKLMNSNLDIVGNKIGKQQPSIPLSLLKPALKPGKNFKWKNDDIKEQYHRLQQNLQQKGKSVKGYESMRAQVQKRIEKQMKSPDIPAPNRWQELSANYDKEHLVAKQAFKVVSPTSHGNTFDSSRQTQKRKQQVFSQINDKSHAVNRSKMNQSVDFSFSQTQSLFPFDSKKIRETKFNELKLSLDSNDVPQRNKIQSEFNNFTSNLRKQQRTQEVKSKHKNPNRKLIKKDTRDTYNNYPQTEHQSSIPSRNNHDIIPVNSASQWPVHPPNGQINSQYSNLSITKTAGKGSEFLNIPTNKDIMNKEKINQPSQEKHHRIDTAIDIQQNTQNMFDDQDQMAPNTQNTQNSQKNVISKWGQSKDNSVPKVFKNVKIIPSNQNLDNAMLPKIKSPNSGGIDGIANEIGDNGNRVPFVAESQKTIQKNTTGPSLEVLKPVQ